MTAPLRLGIAGLGTVGAGVVDILQRHREMISARAGRLIEISAVSARTRTKNRDVDLSAYAWENDPIALATRSDVDLYVELMGGEGGIAKASTEAALRGNKSVVTANKALLALHGYSLAKLAESVNQTIRYEAAVAGGIPVIKTLGEGLAGNQITRIVGVMNGTCNYILTQMESQKLSYEEAFNEADKLGFLETDPKLDVDGIDASHKLAILSALAFGGQVDFGGVQAEGIGGVLYEDIVYAANLGYRIKLLGVAQLTERGLEQHVAPCLVPTISPLGQLENATNMTILEGSEVGRITLSGAGAGRGATASAVLGDIIDIARGGGGAPFGLSTDQLILHPRAENKSPAPYYIRVNLENRPGVLAEVTSVLGQHDISVDRMRQMHTENATVPLLINTHPAQGMSIKAACEALDALGNVADTPIFLRIENVH